MSKDDFCGVPESGIESIDEPEIYMTLKIAKPTKNVLSGQRCLYKFNVTNSNSTYKFGAFIKSVKDTTNTYIYEYSYDAQAGIYFIKNRMREGDLIMLEKGIKKQISVEFDS